MSRQGYDDDLAYGSYRGQRPTEEDGQTGDRGLIGDIYNNLRGRRPHGDQQNVTQQYQPQLYGQQSTQSQASLYAPASSSGRPPSSQNPSSSGGGGGAFSLGKIENALHSIGSQIKTRIDGPGQQHSHTHSSGQCVAGSHDGHERNRFFSFAPERQEGNDAKWYVDACGYMWAVSVAIEQARESIWILDWWLSPELYLRRPPAKNEQYRLDRMLQAAAQRGVHINIIVYKEVTQALTRKLRPSLSPYLHSLIPKTDAFTPILTKLGLDVIFHSLEHVERASPLIEPPVLVNSWYTKNHLEGLHPNIKVFRHPDHLPDTAVVNSSFLHSLQNMKLNAATAAQLPADALKALYGASAGTVLYWAHHEKLCLVDGRTAFMGGIDLCYGRWDTNQHSIADVHPGDLDKIVFPGQDYNNARVMDFQDVEHWQNNKLDRTKTPRMGWSDLSISLSGPIVADYAEHFAQRWNFIYYEKYGVKDERYAPITYKHPPGIVPSSYPPKSQDLVANQAQAQSNVGQGQQSTYGQSSQQGSSTYQPQTSQSGYPPPPPVPQNNQYPPPPGSQSGPSGQYGSGNTTAAGGSNYFPPPPTQASRGLQDEGYSDQRGLADEYGQEGDRGLFGGSKASGGGNGGSSGGFRDQLKQKAQAGFQQIDSRYGARIQGGMQQFDSKFGTHVGQYADPYLQQQDNYASTKPRNGMSCQATRSCSKWSHGVSIEHSIANAYIEVIRNARHFVYIENQFFITANADQQKPIKNRIGAALVERILRAARSRQKFRVIVVMPSVPAFAGDLRSDEALSTRAIMEFQYNSISRGGFSIYQQIANAGYNPLDYIRFYNLRSYDRINVSAIMKQVEQTTGFSYEDARKQHDDIYGGGYSAGGQRGVDDTSRGYQAYHPDQSAQAGPGAAPAGYSAYHAPGDNLQTPATPYGSQYGGAPQTPATPYQTQPGTSTSAYGSSGQNYPPPPSTAYPQQSAGPIELPAENQYNTSSQGYGAPPSQISAQAGQGGYGDRPQYPAGDPYYKYQDAAQQAGDHKGLGRSGRWDSVAECYMLNGEDIREVPWENGNADEMEAFVSEELYIHSKILIADDRVVICGSANLNDRSQLGDHDSEIACIIEDSATIDSHMNGQPFQVGRFAASLRRFLFRKHLGLVKPQDYTSPDANFEPVGTPNNYDWGSDEDRQVADPLDERFNNMWNTIAHTNTQAFAKVFHPVPYDGIRNWDQYEDYYEKYFRLAESKDVKDGKKKPGTFLVGHVVRDEFSPGADGVLKVKEELAKIKGTLVEMPLVFLKEVDLAREGVSFNAFTEEVYT